jgi:hypothetical protein
MGSRFLSHSGRYFAGRSLRGTMVDFPQHNVHQSHALTTGLAQFTARSQVGMD